MKLITLIDRQNPDTDISYGFGPDGNILVAIGSSSMPQHKTYKLLDARTLPVVDIMDWPMVYGTVKRPVSPGVQHTMITYDSWTDKTQRIYFLNGQLKLERKAKALRDLAIAAPDYIDPIPKWVLLYIPQYFGLQP